MSEKRPLGYVGLNKIKVICTEEQENELREAGCLAHNNSVCNYDCCSECCYDTVDNVIFLRERKPYVKREQIKTLIELATSFEDVEIILNKYTDLKTTQEKIAYLQGMFDVEILGGLTTNVEDDYKVIVHAVINEKWR